MADETQQSEEPTTLGKRVSKKPSFFTVANPSTSASKKSNVASEGEGITLADYEYFVDQLGKYKGDDDVLKALHSLIYNTPGKKLEVKKHLKLFSGFAKDANLDEITDKLLDKKKLWTVSILKSALGLFGLLQSGDREDLAKRLVQYLAKPEVVKRGGAGSAGKKKAAGGKKRKSKSSKGGAKKKRSATGFILFGQANREDIKKKNPEASFGELSKLVGQAWNALNESQKKEWEDKAAELRAANEPEAEEEEEDEEGEEEDDDDEEGDGEEAEEGDKKESGGAADSDDDLFD